MGPRIDKALPDLLIDGPDRGPGSALPPGEAGRALGLFTDPMAAYSAVELLELFQRAQAAFTDRVDAIKPDQWDDESLPGGPSRTWSPIW